MNENDLQHYLYKYLELFSALSKSSTSNALQAPFHWLETANKHLHPANKIRVFLILSIKKAGSNDPAFIK